MSTTVPKEIFTFFKKLEKNNTREWFTENKPAFKALESDVKDFYQSVLNTFWCFFW